jgi:hypothetical protein
LANGFSSLRSGGSEAIMTLELIEHLQTRTEPLLVRRSGVVVWTDEERHVAAFEADPVGYALRALVPGVQAQQRARILLRLLDASWAGFDEPTRETLGRVARVLTLGLDGGLVAKVLLALRHRRANHKHVTRAGLRLLFEHRDAATLVRTHRAVLTSVVEHALGKATARGCARALAGEAANVDVQRALLRFTTTTDHLRALYDRTAEVAPTEPTKFDLDLDGARPDTVTATNRGDLAATLVHRFRGGASAELDEAAQRYTTNAAAKMPVFPGALALVLDLSASMRGYGDREWAVLSQVHALRAVFARRCERLTVVPVEQATDLATGVLDALATGPDLVAVVSDGYENVYPGDLARVCATLPRAGINTPVVFCHSTFGHSDDLTLRRPAPSLPQRAFWHEADFAPLMLWLLAHARHADAGQWLHEALLERLTKIEETIR